MKLHYLPSDEGISTVYDQGKEAVIELYEQLVSEGTIVEACNETARPVDRCTN